MLKLLPTPLPDLDTKPFWDGCAEERLLLPRCVACRAFRWPPGPMCPECQSMDTEWIEASGRGTIYSWIVAVHPPAEILVDQVPYVVALVELQEGVRVISNLVDCPIDATRAGLPVEVVFDDPDSHLPNFRPTSPT